MHLFLKNWAYCIGELIAEVHLHVNVLIHVYGIYFPELSLFLGIEVA